MWPPLLFWWILQIHTKISGSQLDCTQLASKESTICTIRLSVTHGTQSLITPSAPWYDGLSFWYLKNRETNCCSRSIEVNRLGCWVNGSDFDGHSISHLRRMTRMSQKYNESGFFWFVQLGWWTRSVFFFCSDILKFHSGYGTNLRSWQKTVLTGHHQRVVCSPVRLTQ
jgi:hypothetical protein